MTKVYKRGSAVAAIRARRRAERRAQVMWEWVPSIILSCVILGLIGGPVLFYLFG